MAQIYKRQVEMEFGDMPRTADVGALRRAAPGATAVSKTLENLGESLTKAYQEEQKIYRKRNDELGEQIIKNAMVTYPDNPEKFAQVVQSGQQKILDQMETKEDKINFRTNMILANNAAQTRIERNFVEKQDRIRTDQIQTDYKTVMQEITNNAHLFYEGADLDPADKEQKTLLLYKKQQLEDEIYYVDKQGKIKPRYDINGNQRVSPEQIKVATELSNNIQYLGMTDHFARTYTKNPIAAQQQYDYLLQNRDAAQKRYGLNDEMYDTAVADMKQIIQKQKSPEQVALESRVRFETEAAFNNLDIDPETGEIQNRASKNMTSLAQMSSMIDRSYATYSGSKAGIEKWGKMSGIVNKEYVKQLTAGQRIRTKWFSREPRTTQDTAIKNADDFLLGQDLIYDPDVTTTREAALANGDYRQQYVQITKEILAEANQAGIDLNSTSPVDKQAINLISQRAIDRSVKTKFPNEYADMKAQYNIKKDEAIPPVVAYRANQKGQTRMILNKRMPKPTTEADVFVMEKMF